MEKKLAYFEVMERLGMTCYISGPEEYRDDEYTYIPFDQAVEEMDILMLLRVQHERHEKDIRCFAVPHDGHSECNGTSGRHGNLFEECGFRHTL